MVLPGGPREPGLGRNAEATDAKIITAVLGGPREPGLEVKQTLTVMPGGPREPGLEVKQTLMALPGVVLHVLKACLHSTPISFCTIACTSELHARPL